MLIVSYRPTYDDGWQDTPNYTRLRIDPLPPGPAGDFLDALLGESAELAPLKKLLIDRTDGNPLFLEECVRSLVETHVLVGRRGSYRPTTAVADLEIPATVQTVLAARIDRLPPREKRLLQCAAVIGEDGPARLLAEISDLSDDTLRETLAHLDHAELLEETRERFRFRHSLTHAVTYETLLHERRRQLHGAIAQAMERLFAEPPRRAPGSPRPSRVRRRAVGQGRRLPAPGRGALAGALRGPGGDGLSRAGAHGPALPAGDPRDHAPGRGHPARTAQRPLAVRSAAGDLRPPGRGPAAGRDPRRRPPSRPRPGLPQQSLLEHGRARPRHRVGPAGAGHRRAHRTRSICRSSATSAWAAPTARAASTARPWSTCAGSSPCSAPI